MERPSQKTTADNIAHRRLGASAGQRLDELANAMHHTFNELEVGVAKSEQNQEKRIQEVEDHIMRIQHSLVVEQQRRVETFNAVESSLLEQHDKLRAASYAKLDALRHDIPDRIVAWHDRLSAAEITMEEERIARQIVIEQERSKLLKTLDDFQRQLQTEKVRTRSLAVQF